MMGVQGYKHKKDLKAAIGHPLNYVETTKLADELQPEYKENGTFTVVGPDAYTKRDWYATVTIKDGLIEKVS